MKFRPKTERLLLNTTPEDRKNIRALLVTESLSSASELLRAALEQYTRIYEHVRCGRSLVFRNEALQREEAMPKHLARMVASTSVEGVARVETSVRQPMEIRLTEGLSFRLKELVAQGAAPSLTALADFALNTYGQVRAASKRGYLLYTRSPDGGFVELDLNANRLSADTEDDAAEECLPPPQGVPLVKVLKLWEPSLKPKHAKTIYLNVSRPLLVCENHDAPRVMIELIKDEHRVDVLDYLIVTRTRSDIDLLRAAIQRKLSPHLPWSAFTVEQRSHLMRRLHEYQATHPHWTVDDSVDPDCCGSSPVWLVVRAIPLLDQHKNLREIADRANDTPSWLVQFADGTCDGWFLEAAGDAESSDRDGNFNEATRALPGQARRQIEALQCLETKEVFRPVILNDLPKRLVNTVSRRINRYNRN